MANTKLFTSKGEVLKLTDAGRPDVKFARLRAFWFARRSRTIRTRSIEERRDGLRQKHHREKAR